MKKIAIIGASGHGKVIADIAHKNGYEEIVFLDDSDHVKECAGYPVIGKSALADTLECDIAIGIGNPKVRERIHRRLSLANAPLPSLIHPNAVISENVSIGKGTVVMAGAVVNSGAVIGEGCIINTCSSVDHDCRLADFVHISVGAHLAGTVHVLDRSWVGIGAVVSNNLKVTSDCMIGAGAIVVSNIEEPGTYVGVPAKKIK